MRKLNLIVVFNKDLSKGLFCIRAKEPYKGKYNFVGGKVEKGESNDEAAYRELFEETGISKNDIELDHFMDLNYFKYENNLQVYYGILKHNVNLVEEKNILKFDNLLNDNIHSFLQRTYNMMINNEYGHYYLIKIAIEKIFILCESYYLMNNNIEQNIDNHYTNRTQECVIESLRYIDNHLSENVKVQDICKYLNVSQSYLYTCFKKVMKTSVSKAIIAYKLDRSLEMLQDKDLRIVDIANNVGFDNIYYFSNSFKKCFGISPTAFRQHYM